MRRLIRYYADYLGITGSTICLLHCLLTSGLTVFSSIMSMRGAESCSHDHGHEHVHEAHVHAHQLSDIWGWLDFSMIFISILAVYLATRHAHHASVRRWLWAGLGMFVTFSFIKFTPWHSGFTDLLSYVGSFMLIGGHFYNMYICRRGISCAV